eukprot:2680945-Rhodomonas_salina.2
MSGGVGRGETKRRSSDEELGHTRLQLHATVHGISRFISLNHGGVSRPGATPRLRAQWVEYLVACLQFSLLSTASSSR